MPELQQDMDFDMQTAWLRRFQSDAESNLKAFALRLREALPEQVTIHESKPFFGKPKVTGVSVVMGENKYTLEIVGGKLKANVALIVREITLNNKAMNPSEWFKQLSSETQKMTDHAKSLSQSLSAFMSS